MRTFRFFVNGVPKAQPRVKARVRYAKGRPFVFIYTPGSANKWKKEIKRAAEQAEVKPLRGPTWMSLTFHMPRPKCHYNKSGLKPTAPAKWHSQKPDADNLLKAVMDALTDFGAWDDDKQVVSVWARKIWALDGGVEIAIGEQEL